MLHWLGTAVGGGSSQVVAMFLELLTHFSWVLVTFLYFPCPAAILPGTDWLYRL